MIEVLQVAMTAIFLLSVLSYYVLLLLPRPRHHVTKRFRSLTIIIPAHNEARTIRAAIDSVRAARFYGAKRIIVVDDGSTDETTARARQAGIMALRTRHLGKAAAINHARARAHSELIAIVDADSTIEPDALEHMATEMGRGCGAACGVINVKNNTNIIGMWLHIEQLYNSLMRHALSKINANIVTPGPLSMYRTDALNAVGGFSTRGFAEDVDITIRLIRAGYRIGFCERSIAHTNMPVDFHGFLRQRSRFARGTLTILRNHLRRPSRAIDVYTLPLLLFAYINALILGNILTYAIITGYITYFVSQGVIVSFAVVRFFVEWFSIAGTVGWANSIAIGNAPLTMLAILSISASFLSYPLFVYALLRFEKKMGLMHLVAFFFLPLYWILTTIIYIALIPTVLWQPPPNKWTKNESKG